MSCRALVKRGRSEAVRTIHIYTRYSSLRERAQSGEAVVRHMGTLDLCDEGAARRAVKKQETGADRKGEDLSLECCAVGWCWRL